MEKQDFTRLLHDETQMLRINGDFNYKVEKNANARKALILKKIEGVKKLHDKYGHECTHLFANLSKDECSTYL